MQRIVFTDTNALIALVCFPKAAGDRRLTLAQEVALAEATGEVSLLITDVVAEELQEVVSRSFPRSLDDLADFFEAFPVVELPPPDAMQIMQLRKLCKDPDDVHVLAAALQCAELYGANYLLSNDIETFHTAEVKAVAVQYGMQVVTLYGLLKVIGWR